MERKLAAEKPRTFCAPCPFLRTASRRRPLQNATLQLGTPDASSQLWKATDNRIRIIPAAPLSRRRRISSAFRKPAPHALMRRPAKSESGTDRPQKPVSFSSLRYPLYLHRCFQPAGGLPPPKSLTMFPTETEK